MSCPAAFDLAVCEVCEVCEALELALLLLFAELVVDAFVAVVEDPACNLSMPAVMVSGDSVTSDSEKVVVVVTEPPLLVSVRLAEQMAEPWTVQLTKLVTPALCSIVIW